jgi:cytochrome c oxidase cbb3-type subunit I/II
MRTIGVPYSEAEITTAQSMALAQGEGIVADLRKSGAEVAADAEIVALIAYLERLGNPPKDRAALPVAHQQP